MRDDAVRAIDSAVSQLLARQPRLVVAVSGGADSAVLLDAIGRLREPGHHIVVATVDHGTGPAATEATARACASAARLGLPAISERLAAGRRDEATLRDARWAFLRRVARAEAAPVVTAHSRDDHIETVVMRVLRGTSARGLAGFLAPSDVERPFVAHRRETIRWYAAQRRVDYVDDPTNRSLQYFRNRVRLELLPAIRGQHPRFEEEMFELSQRAAELRVQVDAVASHYVVEPRDNALVTLDAVGLAQLSAESLRLLLPAILGASGMRLDRRGLVRLASIVTAAPGTRGQLSGGYEAVRTRDTVALVRPAPSEASVLRLRPAGETQFGEFRFRAEAGAVPVNGDQRASSAWRIYIPRNAEPVVRQWHPGDRLTTDLRGGRRRVKRYFADAGVVGPLRTGWPVVLCEGEVVWIPGIKASQAAVRREGKMVHYTCERIRG
jgi:tRNA(Ile)-lysidine synthase